MRSPKAGMPRIVSLSRRLAVVGSLALLLAGCSTSAATPTSAPIATPELTSVRPTADVIVVTAAVASASAR
jgi:PBP1b-binding outer membrane lipoprotein LpoB